MATSQMNEVLEHLRRAVLLRDGAGLTDGQLLQDYRSRRDEAALAALVRRHGPMVWGVCRRVLRNYHDAEDAFQATFLVLVRKAASIASPELLANWLYGVAHKTALKARATTAKRRAREKQVTEMPEPAATEPNLWHDLQPLLDQELSGLPAIYRVAIVLCDLEGKTRKEAARQLGVPDGTLAARLARGRGMLAKRLARHGLAVAGGSLATVLSQSAASASAPTAVVVSTIKAASLFAAGRTAASGALSAKAAALTEGVLKTMLLTKLKIATAVVVVVAVLAAGASSLKHPAPAAEPPPPKADKPTAVQATPKPARPGRLLVWKGDGFVSVTPDGQEGDRLPGQVNKLFLNEPVVAPDGKRVAFTVNDEPKLDAHGFRRRKVFVRDLDGKDPGQTFPVNALNLFWSPDGRALYAVWSQRGKEPKDVVLRLSLIDLATGETKRIDLPPSVHPFAVTPDDKTIVVAEYDGTVRPRKIFLALIPRGGTDITRLTEIWTKEPEARVSPDGTRILFQDSGPAEKPSGNEASSHRLFVYDLTTKTRTQLAEIPPNAAIVGFCWSPDGKKVAYTWRQTQPGEPPPDWAKSKNDPKLKPGTESFLVIADPDGKHPKTVLSGSDATTIATVDWR